MRPSPIITRGYTSKQSEPITRGLGILLKIAKVARVHPKFFKITLEILGRKEFELDEFYILKSKINKIFKIYPYLVSSKKVELYKKSFLKSEKLVELIKQYYLEGRKDLELEIINLVLSDKEIILNRNYDFLASNKLDLKNILQLNSNKIKDILLNSTIKGKKNLEIDRASFVTGKKDIIPLLFALGIFDEIDFEGDNKNEK